MTHDRRCQGCETDLQAGTPVGRDPVIRAVKEWLMAPKFSVRLPAFGTIPLSESPVRLHVLDGIRGWASLVVVCFHMSWEMFGNIEPLYRNPFTAGLLDGQVAVSVFFVLSGEALSIGFFSGKGRRSIINLAVKRYPRLTIPILINSLLILFLYWSRLICCETAGALVHRPDWLSKFMLGNVDFTRAMSFSLYKVFVNRDPFANFDPFLWTMRLELIGSIIVFLILYVGYGSRTTWPLLIMATLLFLSRQGDFGQIACFLAGISFAKLRLSGSFGTLSHRKGFVFASYVALLVVIALDGLWHSTDTHRDLCPLLAIIVVLCISINPRLTRFMENSASQFLGRISFPLFLVQFPVIISLSSGLVIYARNMGFLHHTTFVIVLISVSASILCAILFEPVETFTKIACDRVSRLVMGYLPEAIGTRSLPKHFPSFRK